MPEWTTGKAIHSRTRSTKSGKPNRRKTDHVSRSSDAHVHLHRNYLFPKLLRWGMVWKEIGIVRRYRPVTSIEYDYCWGETVEYHQVKMEENRDGQWVPLQVAKDIIAQRDAQVERLKKRIAQLEAEVERYV